ncbi:hypothetical protein VHEMI05710 [[Torrubiella] hemipterigena]|nr:hypothetical protein VHEMI05710 [[Torrubiella] hemipterigena]
MELFFSNVPNYLTEVSLRQELEAHAAPLGIRTFVCDKPRHKTFAWVTFLDEQDGKKFLAKHGKEPTKNVRLGFTKSGLNLKQRAIPKLFILNNAVFVEPSTRHVDADTIQTLKYMKHQQSAAARPKRVRDHSSISCTTNRIACGKLVLKNGTVTFACQASAQNVGMLKFGRKFAILDTLDESVYIAYGKIQECIADFTDKSFTFVLEDPPRFYLPTPSEYGGSRLTRMQHIYTVPNHDKYVAHCLVYRVWYTGERFSDLVRSLKSRDFDISKERVPVDERPEPRLHDYSTCLKSFTSRLSQMGNSGRLIHFGVLFQVQALVWNNYLHPKDADHMLTILETLARAAQMNDEPIPFTTESMKVLFSDTPYPSPQMDQGDLDVFELMEKVRQKEAELSKMSVNRDPVYGGALAPNHVWVFKAMVTPTRIVLNGPDTETCNSVLHKFAKHQDYFLRVTFCDEDGSNLTLNPRVNNGGIFDRFHSILKQGINIAGRKFAFLAFSHSSLRSHSTWFSAPFTDSNMRAQTYESILRGIGDFKDIRVAAKCAARIGQAFSETPYTVDMTQDIRVRYIPEVKNSDGDRVFSDGVGTISSEALKRVRKVLPESHKKATCIQIRLGGIKGMLSLDTRLKGSLICIRKESMMKFPSTEFVSMGICDTSSRPLKFVLNRQIIKILEDMGTKHEWFFSQQNRALRFLQGVASSPLNTSTFLRQQAIGSAINFPKFITRLDSISIDYRRDSFLKGVVDHVLLRELRLLKHKARIPVEKGITLFGVMDETAFLQEGEVYVDFDSKVAKTYGVDASSLSEGPLIVTRSPALHPGDVQIAALRIPPAGHPLRNLKNCIVFSQKGSRDLPSQLSGGDLDGDLYSVIWDPDAIPLYSFAPADYPRVSPVPLDRAVTREDITEFFINFMKNDILGLIASRHQVLADVTEGGTASHECIELAELHSTAVDYSKTGIPVSVADMPRAPKTRPDFVAPAPPTELYTLGQIDFLPKAKYEEDEEGDDGLGRPSYKYHLSQKILGLLFRDIDEEKIWSTDMQLKVDYSGPSIWTQLLDYMQYTIEKLGMSSWIDYTRRFDQARKIRRL